MDSIDLEYIWQRRIHSGIRYQKGAVPFPDSVAIGLDFNVGSQRKEKLDPGLLTNGVMLDICDFAKAVNKAEKYFIHEILDFNFDLGVGDDKQCHEFATRVHSRAKCLKDIIKNKHHRWQEVFVLPTFMVSSDSQRPSHCSAKMSKISEKSGLADGSRNGHLDRIASELQKTDSSGAGSGEVIIRKPRGVRVKLTQDLYPFCKKIGLSLDIRPKETPKEKLDLDLLTNGAMREVFDFAKVLCGRHAQIVFDLLEHNFNLDLDKVTARTQITKLMERRNNNITANIRGAFRSEAFRFQSKTPGSRWKKRWAANMEDQAAETQASKRKRKPKHLESFVFESIGSTAGSREDCWPDSDLSYTCPVDAEREMQSGPEAGEEKMKMGSCLSGAATETKSTALLEVKQEEEEISLSPVLPWSNPSCKSYYSPISYNTTQESIPGLFSKSTNRDTPVETAKLRLWRRRDARSKQILSMSSRVNDAFAHCREIRLDFNVGSGKKQNIDLQLLTNGVLFEVYKFAHLMMKTRCNFIFDILKRNFSLDLQDELHQRNFLFYITTKVKLIQGQPCKNNMEFLSSVFQLPEVYNMVDVTGEFRPPQDVLTEQRTNWNPPSASATSQEANMEPYPFCKKLGLNLWSMEERPMSERLDLSLLTNGALLEVVSFAKELCGAVWQTVYDVLEHNFDLDLQNGKSEVAQCIQKWYMAQKYLIRKPYSATAKGSTWLNTVVQLTRIKRAYIRTHHRPPGPHSNRLKENMDEQQLGQDIKKEADVQQVQTVKCSSFPLCKDIGLDLEISCKSETKAKLDLQVLTRSVVHELHRYVQENSEFNYVPALYEILEYNFDLSSQSHRRWEFAWSIAAQVKAMVGKNRLYLSKKGDYPNKVFELPFEFCRSANIVCKEEPDYNYDRLDPDDGDILFVRELIPIDIEVELD